MQAVKTTSHINEGKGATLVPDTLKLLQPIKKKSGPGKRVAGLA